MPDDSKQQPDRWRNPSPAPRVINASGSFPSDQPRIILNRPSQVPPPTRQSQPQAQSTTQLPHLVVTPAPPQTTPALQVIPSTSIPSPEPVPTHHPKKSSSHKRRLLIASIAVAIILLGVGGTLLVVSIMASLSGPVAISNQFINAIQTNNPQTAYSLTSASFKAAASEQQLASVMKTNLSINLTGPEKLTAQKVATNSGYHQAAITYSVVNSGVTRYMRVVLQQTGGKWQVVNFNSSNKPLADTIQ